MDIWGCRVTFATEKGYKTNTFDVDIFLKESFVILNKGKDPVLFTNIILI